ncbi:putative exodeoxyribonuclease III [Dioscorea sansibarensis]
MSLTGMWLANLHQGRDNLASSCRIKLLRFHTVLASKEVVCPRKWILRPTTATVEEKKQKSNKKKACKNNLIIPKTVGSPANICLVETNDHEPKTVQNIGIQQKVTENRVIDRPAVFIVVDIETTGFSRTKDRIIEIAFRDLNGGKNSTFQTLVRPDKLILNENIHGISSQMVNRPGVPRFDELIPIILQYVRSRQIDGKPVVFIAHNGRRFDIPFIISEFQRCSTEIPNDWLFLDTLPLASKLVKPDGSKLESVSLNALQGHYKVPLVGPAHRAMQDVITLSFVFSRITFDLRLTFREIMDGVFRASDLIKHEQ